MQLDLNYWLDFLFPRQGVDVANIHGYLSADFLKKTKAFSRIITGENAVDMPVLICADYQDSEIKDLIHRLKFEGELAILEDLTSLVATGIVQSGLLSQGDLLTCVPPDPKRYRQRGYHIPELLAKKVAAILNLPFESLLRKKKHTRSQVEMMQQEREVSLRQAFEFRAPSVQSVDKLWILDDVTTTGATLKEALRAVHQVLQKTRVLGVTVAG